MENMLQQISLSFAVADDDFCFSNENSSDTLTSDGVHLLLCGTKEYSYNSIFFFPKAVAGRIEAIACDVLSSRNVIFRDDLIETKFVKKEQGYIITAVLSNAFLKNEHLDSYFYMGVAISDCSSKTSRRENQLILSQNDAQWYNPIYFARVDVQQNHIRRQSGVQKHFAVVFRGDMHYNKLISVYWI